MKIENGPVGWSQGYILKGIKGHCFQAQTSVWHCTITSP